MPRPKAPAKASIQKARMHRVLIVDDVEEMRVLLKGVFEDQPDFEILTCASTVEARVELTRRRPSLILLDELLPGESSLDFYQEIATEGIPVFFITGMEQRSDPVPQKVLGRLKKPSWKTFSADQKTLLQAIRKALSG